MSDVEERDCKRCRLCQRGGSFLMTDFPDVLLKACLSFVGPGNYRYVAATCKRFQEQYIFRKETTWRNAVLSVSRAKLCHKDHKDAPAEDLEKVFLFLEDAAAHIGNVRVLQWMLDDHSCATGKDELAAAGLRGCVNVLEFAEENNLPWMSDLLCTCASGNGHVRMLRWIHQRCPDEMDYSIVAHFAARGGHISILRWLHDSLNLLASDNDDTWRGAISGNQIHVLDWLVQNDFELHEQTDFWAPRFGHIEVLAWAEAHGIAWTTDACTTAAAHGHLDALKWLRQHNCPWNGVTIYFARERGQWDIVQWARENGCPEPPAELFE